MFKPMPKPTYRSVDTAVVPQLITHSHKPKWGRGALIWARPTKRAYQFEDGHLRKFKKPFYDMLDPVDTHTTQADELLSRLQTRGEARQTVLEARRMKRKAAPPVDAAANLDRQIQWFKKAWPDGFVGKKWRNKLRVPKNKTLKRHREPLVERAQQLLNAVALQRRINERDATGLHEAWMALLDTTDVVPPSHKRALAAMDVDHAWLEKLNALIHGDGPFDLRFERWVSHNRRIGPEACTWPLMTAPLALFNPDEWLLIRRRITKAQLARLRPGLPMPKVPSAPAYASLRDVLAPIHQALLDADLEPADQFDIYDFIRVTMRPKARNAMDA